MFVYKFLERSSDREQFDIEQLSDLLAYIIVKFIFEYLHGYPVISDEQALGVPFLLKSRFENMVRIFFQSSLAVHSLNFFDLLYVWEKFVTLSALEMAQFDAVLPVQIRESSFHLLQFAFIVLLQFEYLQFQVFNFFFFIFCKSFWV